MEFLPYIYLGYMFISLYFLSLYFILYLKNKNDIFSYPEIKKEYSISVLSPAFNEEDTIADTLKHIFDMDYKNILEVIVINDKSTDNTLSIVKGLMKKYPRLKVIDNKKNLGKAGSLNKALKIATGELIAVIDADSYPHKDAFSKMVGFFEEEKVGAVTVPVVARNKNNFIEKLQAIEYKAISITRKLLGYVDAIYVTPGPLALYRGEAIRGIEGFDEKNMTEDIEATWKLTAFGWDRRMCLDTGVSSTVPSKFKDWYVQRRRWNIGGLQCIWKYRKFLIKKGMLGWFIIPFFILSTFLGLLGLSIFFYLITRRAISNFLFTKYSISVGTPVLTLNDLYITPSILNYLGIVLFVLGAVFTLLVLSLLKERILKRQNILNILFYLTFYIAIYPFVMIGAMFHFIRGKRIWR